ncbi:MAG: NAD-dependent epimerase/dehydratase family protein [Selenomonadaceae bacterium]|nr:NAD-dependent epimerase/dehydratase family protein [Selenomonadaceae bacterium]MDY3916734.1 NAD-dependent epimerase/dehydratase family protein [Selenomonadaceae bacterium]
MKHFIDIYQNPLYQEDIQNVVGLTLPWEKLQNKVVLVSGARGLLGSFFIDVIMYKNLHEGLNCHIFAMGRNEAKLKERFSYCIGSPFLTYVVSDVNQPLEDIITERVDYILHLASNTHPVAYATDPIGTIMTNVVGLQYMLDIAVERQAKRFVFASSNEIYGENRGDTEKFAEDYCGYIDCNTLRAGYPESKRCGEALCQAYKQQKGLDVVISRFTRSYGPSLQESDTKAMSQFLHKAINHQDIVLKSEGKQFYSYTYMADAVSGLLTIMLLGESGKAYNISDERSDIHLKDLAKLIADYASQQVVFDIPDQTEQLGYSKATKALLDSGKLKELGWRAQYNIRQGVWRTLEILFHCC